LTCGQAEFSACGARFRTYYIFYSSTLFSPSSSTNSYFSPVLSNSSACASDNRATVLKSHFSLCSRPHPFETFSHTSLLNMSQSAGSIIAFEGRQDVVSAQMRLLPASSQVLVLPSIEAFLPSDTSRGDFESRTYIRELHNAAKARYDAARDFLQDSKPSDKRLVFMQGGTSHAHALCIKAIMQHETNGNATEAEDIFMDLLLRGTAGFEVQGEAQQRSSSGSPPERSEDNYNLEDPITKAMRAAEALDRLTAGLQPSTELDLTLASRPRCSSLPMCEYPDHPSDSAPFLVFGGQDDEPAERSSDELFDGSRSSTISRGTMGEDKKRQSCSHLAPSSPTSPIGCISEYDVCSAEAPSKHVQDAPWSDIYSPFSPRWSQAPVFGQAIAVDVRASARKAVRRVKSLDRVYALGPKHRDPSLPLEASGIADVTRPRERPSSCINGLNKQKSLNIETKRTDRPRSIFVKARRPLTSIVPVPHEQNQDLLHAINSPVTQPTNTEDILPFTEHLAIYFKDDAPDDILESVIASFKADGCPDSPSTSTDGSDLTERSLPPTPQSPQTFVGHRLSVVSEESSFIMAFGDEHDSFARMHPLSPRPKSSSKTKRLSMERPLTLSKTPTPPTFNHSECFHDFLISPQQTAVAIQNALRSVLNIYYPAESKDHCQFQFSLPEIEGRWNPTYREAPTNGPRKTKRRTDQIIAIGCQGGVSKDMMSTVSERLAKLGTTPNGESRTSRLDFRYLLAKAMQAYTAQPLAQQTCDNPFNNPYLLATLIVPQLEKYQALHAANPYILLEYPPEHLATILALRKLVGVDVMKVAQVANIQGTEQMPFVHIRTGSAGGTDGEDSAASRTHKRSPSSAEVAFDKVNFLLASSAGEADIETFVATVRNVLTEVSSFYKHEENSPRSMAPSLQSRFSSVSRLPSTYTKTATATSPVTTSWSFPTASSTRRSSLGETIVSTASKSISQSRSWRDTTISDCPSVYTLDLNIDHDLRMEERRLMPRYRHKPSHSEGKKAFKFLGLE
jgi:hypothetical protein